MSVFVALVVIDVSEGGFLWSAAAPFCHQLRNLAACERKRKRKTLIKRKKEDNCRGCRSQHSWTWSENEAEA